MGSLVNRFLTSVSLLCLVVAAAFGQSPVWADKTPGAFDTKMGRDIAGNIYVAMADATPSRSELWLKKYNALGVLQFARLLRSRPYGRPYTVTDIEVTNTHIAVSAYNTNADTGEKTAGYVTTVTTDNVQSWSDDLPASYPIAISSDLGTLSVALETASDVDVRRYDLVSGTQGAVSTIAGFTAVRDCAAVGTTTYVIGGNQLAAVVGAGTLFNLVIDSVPHNNEQLYKLIADPANVRLFVIGEGNHLATLDVDTFVVSRNLITGASINANTVGIANADDYFRAAVMDPSSNLYVATHMIGFSTTQSVVTKLTPTLTLGPSLVQTSGTESSMAIAYAAPDVFLAETKPGDITRLTRLSATTGAIRYNVTYAADPTANSPTGLAVDSAGNFFVAGNYDSGNLRGAYIARVGYAWITTSTGVPVGGSSVTATMNVAEVSNVPRVFTLVSSNTAVAQVPSTVTVGATALSQSFNVTTSAVAANTNVTINATYNGYVTQKTITVLPPNVASVAVNPNIILGGQNSTGTVTLTGPAPTGGLTVNLGTSPNLVATTPPSVVVPAGASNANFTVFTAAVQANTGVVVSATFGTTTKTAFFAVNAPSLTTFSVNPTTVQGGTTFQTTVGLDGVAPTDGRSITTFSGAPGIVFMPATIVVQSGQTTRSINISTSSVTSTTLVTLFATRSGIYKTATVTVTP